MKKMAIWMVCAALLLSGCGTYAGQGAAVGGEFGTILGSAVGGLTGGWRGSNVGKIVGLAGGAMVGAAIGAAADEKANARVEEYRERKAAELQRERERRNDSRYSDSQNDVYPQYNRQNDYSNDDSYPQYNRQDSYGSNDDRIDFNGAGPTGSSTSRYNSRPSYDNNRPSYDNGHYGSAGSYARTDDHRGAVEIRNLHFVDANHDGVISAGEKCQVIFEVMNHSSQTIYSVQPTVNEVTGNKNLRVSPNLHVKSIRPHSGVRYTANVLGTSRLRDGEVILRVGVTVEGRPVGAQMHEIPVMTRRH